MKRLGKIKTLAVGSLAAIAIAAPIAIAQNGQGGPEGRQEMREGRGRRGGHRGGHRGGFGFRGIELTDDQKARLQQLREGFGERTRSLREQLRAKRQELRQANDGATFNEALATQKLTEAAALEAKLMGEQFRLRQESLAILTPEQRTQLEQRREQRKQRREQRRGQGGGESEMF
ncbi:MAG TPA: Spy/CpxP family protein refolding chaperone [Pyrinomonadaceae bacterium]|nr:Spy/CpxP family protein refolding chaperone [Pyrinomonadaceae bacterium]